MGRPAAAAFRAIHALNDHWIGDLIGAVSLFALGYLLFFAALVLEPAPPATDPFPDSMETQP